MLRQKGALPVIFLATTLLGFPVVSNADVTLYGLVDSALRYSTNASKTDASLVQFSQGAVTGSRWGIRGNEDLGSGLRAVFVLESGFNAGDGTSLQSSSAAGYATQSTNGQGRLFGRQAYVGLSSKFGSLTFGRQYGASYDATIGAQVFGNPNLDALIVAKNYTGSQLDNTVKYAGEFHGVTVDAAYSFGNVPGDIHANSGLGYSLGYTTDDMHATLLYQRLASATSSENRTTVGFSVGYGSRWDGSGGGPLKIDAGYLHSRLDFAGTRDDVLFLGANYLFAPQFSLGIQSAMDWQSPSGHRAIVYAIADYLFSKRTDIYVETDFNRITGKYPLIASQGTEGSKVGVTLGLRTKF